LSCPNHPCPYALSCPNHPCPSVFSKPPLPFFLCLAQTTPAPLSSPNHRCPYCFVLPKPPLPSFGKVGQALRRLGEGVRPSQPPKQGVGQPTQKKKRQANRRTLAKPCGGRARAEARRGRQTEPAEGRAGLPSKAKDKESKEKHRKQIN